MKKLFKCAVTTERTNEEGLVKSVKEIYIVDAMTCAEAEARVTEEVSVFSEGEFEVSDITRYKVSEYMVRDGNDEDFYEAKVCFVTFDEQSGKEKVKNSKILIRANSLDSALSLLKGQLKGSMSDWEIVLIKKTDIIDLFEYEAVS